MALPTVDPQVTSPDDLTNRITVTPMPMSVRDTKCSEGTELPTRRQVPILNSHESEPLSNPSSVDAVTNSVNIVPVDGKQIRQAIASLPEPGDIAFGFRLQKELGRGTFGRVYLASQTELAARPVALKVSANLVAESRALALLQHTNIVPVYSVHRSESHQAVCMPYFGSTTLATLLRHYRTTKSIPTSGRELIDTLKNIGDQTLPKTAPTIPEESKPSFNSTEGATDAIRTMLAGWTYTQASCWLIARLADGLGHAHERGILHRDIKPANVLITDDGQPMLLDFGVAEEVRLRATVTTITVGGTLPYMAPEQLEEIQTGRPQADARSDIFSLGIVLYELLTGVHPYRTPSGRPEEETARMIEERRAGPASVRTHNLDVTPGLESIVQTCLAGDPAKRYQSATQLRDDLDRYLADQPLLVAPEKSFSEQARKWSRRHPRLTSHLTIFSILATLLVATSVGLTARYNRLHQLEAEERYREFSEATKSAQYLLYSNVENHDLLQQGMEKAKAALALYGTLDNPNWEQQSTFVSLPDEQRKKLRRDIAETCLMLARGQILLSSKAGKGEPALINEALRLNLLAERIAENDPPRLIYSQRKVLQQSAGRLTEATQAESLEKSTPLTSARDYYLAGVDAQQANRPAEALVQYRKAQAIDPKLFWAYFGEGIVLDQMGRYPEARGAYTAAIALWPDFVWTYHNRGAAYAHMGSYDAAVEDFSHAIELQPEFAESHIARAVSYQNLKEFELALRDIDAAIGLGISPNRALPIRAEIRKAMGDVKGASKDAESVAKNDPTTVDGWILRGIDKMVTNKEAALADFQKALEVNPRSLNALLYIAHVQDQLGNLTGCIESLDQVLKIDPRCATAYSARGTMHARLKHWDAAANDAKSALGNGFAPAMVFQVAEIYAQLSTQRPEYKDEAITLLTIAIRNGFGFDHLDNDELLNPIRKTPEFEKIRQLAKKYKPTTPK